METPYNIPNRLDLSFSPFHSLHLPSRAHAAELGNKVPEEPLLFLKPTTAYVTEGRPIVVKLH